MSEWNLIGLNESFIVALFAVVGLYIKILLKQKESEKDIANLRSSFNMHEQQNEKAFDKVDKKLDTMITESKHNNENIFIVINELKTILMKRNNE